MRVAATTASFACEECNSKARAATAARRVLSSRLTSSLGTQVFFLSGSVVLVSVAHVLPDSRHLVAPNLIESFRVLINLSAGHGRRLFRVIRVIWTVHPCLPVFPRKRTSSRPGGMSQECQERTHHRSKPAYSITSSARASSVGGNSSPSALAVLRLRTRSYFDACSTGKSDGFSPLRILSM